MSESDRVFTVRRGTPLDIGPVAVGIRLVINDLRRDPDRAVLSAVGHVGSPRAEYRLGDVLRVGEYAWRITEIDPGARGYVRLVEAP